MKALLTVLPAVTALVAAIAAHPALEGAVERCRAALEREKTPPCLETAAASLAPAILEDRWEGLGALTRARFRKALATDFGRKLAGLESLEPQRSPEEGGRARYRFRQSGREGEATLLLDARGELEDVLVDGRSAVGLYRDVGESILSRYGVSSLVAELDGSGVVVLEDFEDGPSGGVPEGWSSRGFGREVQKVPYRVVEEGGNRFLRAEDRGENVLLYSDVRWSSQKYPYLSWRWRIRAVPEGADERFEDKADSAAGLYLSYRRRFALVPETVKFVFSSHLEPGTAFRRPGIGMPWTVVAASGAAEATRWQRFVYRTESVYRRTFEGDPGGRPLGVAILTDANSTGSFAAADYDDIVALERAEDPDSIRRIVELP